jgi:hypothetical protein
MKQKASSRADIWRTIWNALTLNTQLYETVSSDRRTRGIALMIVILAALSRAFASMIISLLNRVTLPVLIISLLLGIFSVIIGYYFWSFTIWKAGQWLKWNPPTYDELRCPIGFAYAPQVLNFLTIIPLLGRPIELILSTWTVLAVTIAVSSAMNISMLRAVLISMVCVPVVQIVPILIQVLSQQFTQ